MPQPPLNIENYFIDEITVKANPDFDPKRGQTKTGINISSNVGQKKDDDLRFRVWMDIKAGNVTPEAFNSPYNIHLTLRGFFSFAKGTPKEIVDKMLSINGTSILYGIGRGVVVQITASGPNGKFILPATNLISTLGVKGKETKTEAGRQRRRGARKSGKAPKSQR
jgi:preprotein translocase subunit SecB